MENDILHNMHVRRLDVAHFPVVFIIDNSQSMGDDRITKINNAIADFVKTINNDEFYRDIVDLFFASLFNKSGKNEKFLPTTEIRTIKYEIEHSVYNTFSEVIEIIKERVRLYRRLGTPCFKPLIVTIASAEMYINFHDRFKELVSLFKANQYDIIFVGTEECTKECLIDQSKKTLVLINDDFSALFNWVFEAFLKYINYGMPSNERGDLELPVNIVFKQ